MEEFENQEQEPTSTFQTSLRYGVIFGLVAIILFVGMIVSGQSENIALSLLSFAIYAAIIVMAHNYFKKANNGYMSYSQGLGIGSLTMGIGSTISGAFSVIYFNFIDPNFQANQLLKARRTIEETYPQFNEDQIEQTLQISKMMTQPLVLLAFSVIGGFLIGFIISLIISAFTRKNAPLYE